MNWVFETYSSVYSTAMMRDTKLPHQAETGKKSGSVSRIAKFLGRG